MERVVLPGRYLRGFAARGPLADGDLIWVYRPPIGEWQKATLEAVPGRERHFNDGGDAVADLERLERELGDAAESGLTPLVGSAETGQPLAGEDRRRAARLLALFGILRSPGAGSLPRPQAEEGVAKLEAALSEMGWVFWRADEPDYFITSSAALRVAYPEADAGWIEALDVSSPGVEITFPLTPRSALHASWKLRGERWRRAGEDALMEINARTAQRARGFLAAPWPAVPG